MGSNTCDDTCTTESEAPQTIFMKGSDKKLEHLHEAKW